MIPPSRSDAPHFQGSALDLVEFLDDYELLATQAQLSADEQCKRLYKYASPKEGALWKLLTERMSQDWTAYRAAIVALYPGATSARQYTNADLRKFVNDHHANTAIRTIDDLGDYHREFLRHAAPLISATRLSDIDRDELYYSGFPPHFQERLYQRLIVAHVDHNEGDTFAMSEVYKVAGHLL
ncbi:hypothetical protein BD410DRAFT_735601, partial [Rickenella mellea]